MKNRFLIGAASIATAGAMLLVVASVASFANAATPPTPAVSSITPTSGTTAGGTVVTITGTGLTNATAVDFGGTAATDVTASSTAQVTSLTATAPATTTAGMVDVTVTTAGGTSATSSADQFTYVTPAPVAPTVSSIAPTSGTTAGGTPVVITGTGFTGATAVDFGSTPGTITVRTNDNSITATAPATTTAGMVDVRVVTPNGTSATSSADMFTYTAPVATTTEPVISDVNVTTSGTSTAMVTWMTDLPSSSQVFYGMTSAYDSSSTLDSTLVTSHSVTLNDLSEATLYHFDVQSTEAGNTATSSDMTFMTGSSASTTPLAVNGVTTDQGTATADGTFADGWLWVMHLTVPTIEDAFRMAFSDFTSTNSSSTIPANADIQIYSPESSNASTSASAITETGNGYSNWMYLNGDTATSTAGRQVDVYINVAVPLGTAAGSYTTNFAAQSTPSNATSTTI